MVTRIISFITQRIIYMYNRYSGRVKRIFVPIYSGDIIVVTAPRSRKVILYRTNSNMASTFLTREHTTLRDGVRRNCICVTPRSKTNNPRIQSYIFPYIKSQCANSYIRIIFPRQRNISYENIRTRTERTYGSSNMIIVYTLLKRTLYRRKSIFSFWNV